MWKMVEFYTIDYVQNTDLSMFTKKCVFLIACCIKRDAGFLQKYIFKDKIKNVKMIIIVLTIKR